MERMLKQVGIVDAEKLTGGFAALRVQEKDTAFFIKTGKIPEWGWSELQVEGFLNQLASMDSNNFKEKGSVGEREGRVYSSLVQKRHFHMSHGIGRSGNLTEMQPKAVGSTLLAIYANTMARDFVKKFVSQVTEDAIVLPMATGMSITLVLLTMKKKKLAATHVIWSRCDQQSCIKAVLAAGLKLVVVDKKEDGNNAEEIMRKVEELGDANVLCVITTTSCFAPRKCDEVEKVSRSLRERKDVFHLVNNAYGVQSTKCANQVNLGLRNGRLDVYVQSTDKNLMVPVGGAIVAGDKGIISSIASCYPGRASATPSMDVLITLLQMGWRKYQEKVKLREEMFGSLETVMREFAGRYGETLICDRKRNDISMALTLKTLTPQHVAELGPMLFTRNVLGARVVVPGAIKNIEGYEFKDWGSHGCGVDFPYLTVAASLDIDDHDIKHLKDKLYKCFRQLGYKQVDVSAPAEC